MADGVEQINCRGAKFRRGASFLNFKWGVGDNLVVFTSPKKDGDKVSACN